jgi:hypothetical protein
MKTQFWSRLVLAVSITVAVLSAGCANKKENPAAEVEPSSPPPPVAIAFQDPVQKLPPALPVFSPGIADVVRLVQANLEESVVLSYVDTSPIAYDPSADEIVYLKDIGVTSEVISSLLRRGQMLRETTQLAAVDNATNTPASDTNFPSIAAQSVLGSQPPAAATAASGLAQSNTRVVKSALTTSTGSESIVDLNVFYDALSPYGSWMQVPDYGWVWQPSVEQINPDWEPYCDGGHWLYTDTGWYWMSDYTWGWAPFHYGRWFHHPTLSWLWVPDTVWGPAWVCWRRTPLYCGWAPLPPAAVYEYGRGFCYYGVTVGSDYDYGLSWDYFVFIHYQHFCAPDPRHHVVDRPHAHDLYGHSTVNNHYILGPNHAIINKGVDYSKVVEFSRVESRKVSVRDLPPAAGRTVKPDRIEKDGSALVIYKPQPQYRTPVLTGTVARPASATSGAKTGTALVNTSKPATRIPNPAAATELSERSSGAYAPETPRNVATPAYLSPDSLTGSRSAPTTRGTAATTWGSLPRLESERPATPVSTFTPRNALTERRPVTSVPTLNQGRSLPRNRNINQSGASRISQDNVPTLSGSITENGGGSRDYSGRRLDSQNSSRPQSSFSAPTTSISPARNNPIQSTPSVSTPARISIDSGNSAARISSPSPVSAPRPVSSPAPVTRIETPKASSSSSSSSSTANDSKHK